MRLSSFKELESRKRYLTLGRIGVILGIHLLVFGGGYVVTQFGGSNEEDKTSYAGANGIVNWSNQSENANTPTVDGTADSLFDTRSGDLTGYNEGGPRVVQIASSQTSSSSSGRYAPRRPTNDSSQTSTSTRNNTRSSDDTVLQPLNRGSNSAPLSPVRSSGAPSSSIEYKVQNGDSLWGISKRFNVTVNEIVALNPGIKADSIRVGQSVRVPRTSGAATNVSSAGGSSSTQSRPTNANVYVVKSGDSLSRIASRQGVTVSELRNANGLRTDMIRIGQELVIPSSTRKSNIPTRQHTGIKYVVEPGDTLDKIAAVYDVTISELKDLNDIADPRLIRIGQTLSIPEKTTASPASSSRNTPTPRNVPLRQEPVLDTLDSFEPQEEALPSLGELDTLSEFDDEDLDDSLMIPIEE